MSQYGAYGAAQEGMNWKQILTFYYPGTTPTSLSANTVLKVWVTGDTDGTLRVLPSPGLKVRDGVGDRYTVPTGAEYKSWRISRFGSGYRLSYRNADGETSPRGPVCRTAPGRSTAPASPSGSCCPAGRCGPTGARWR